MMLPPINPAKWVNFLKTVN